MIFFWSKKKVTVIAEWPGYPNSTHQEISIVSKQVCFSHTILIANMFERRRITESDNEKIYKENSE